MGLLDQPAAGLDAGAAPAATLGFACPRCSAAVEERFYGPCSSCRTELRSLYAAEARQVEQQAYEPKLNVTPNAVAVKE